MDAGRDWVIPRVAELDQNRALVRGSLSDALGPENVFGGEGAIYLWAKLPRIAVDDWKVAANLVKEHGVTIIPGTSCGCPGFIRAAFANLSPEVCREASERLHKGLLEIPR